MFKKRAKNERGHVEFITSAVKHMKDYGLHKDLETYKALMDVFPRGPFRTTTAVQVNHYNYVIYGFRGLKSKIFLKSQINFFLKFLKITS